MSDRSKTVHRGSQGRRGAGGGAGAGGGDSRLPAPAAAGIDDDAAVVGRRREVAALFRAAAGTGRRRTACNICPWECRTIWKSPSRKARRWCAWERPCSVRAGKIERLEGRILFAAAAGAHRRGRLFRRAARARWSRSATVEVNARDADVALYHLGNNRLHREIYQRALGSSRCGGAARRRAASFLSRTR